MMSRLKRQRLATDGRDRVSARVNEDDESQMEVVEQRKDHSTELLQGRSLFVHSLPASATTESLTDLFSHSYPIRHATVVLDPTTKKSKSYGFVTFADAEDARCAKETFNRSLFQGRKIRVDFAQPRHRQAYDGDSAIAAIKKQDGRQKSEPERPPKLIVRNLPWTIREPDDLASLFRSYGKVKHVIIPKTKPGLSAGFGFVVLRGKKNAEKALQGVNGKEISGRTLAVDWAVDKVVWETSQIGNTETEVHDSTARDQTKENHDESAKPEESWVVPKEAIATSDIDQADGPGSEGDGEIDLEMPRDYSDEEPPGERTQTNSSTLFIRNLPFTTDDESLKEFFGAFGPVRYARVVLDHATERSRGTAFVAFHRQEDADACLQKAPHSQPTPYQIRTKEKGRSKLTSKQSILEDTNLDQSGRYIIEGRVLNVSRAVDRREATLLTVAGTVLRDARDKDKRRLYLLSEGTLPSGSPLYDQLLPSEIKMREDSAKQRQSLIRSNPMLHLSLTRLSVRNLSRSITSKDLKALAREAIVEFAKDVRAGVRQQLSKDELSRGGDQMRGAEEARKAKGKGVVKQAKVVFEGREGGKVAEDSGAGRSRGYGFIEYSSHRWALMGLRWLNGHEFGPFKVDSTSNNVTAIKTERKKRLVVEFAIENAQVVGRRQERENKARERSKLISEKRANGELPKKAPKPFSEDQLMARTRKAKKRKQASNGVAPERDDAASVANEPGKSARRQQIVGRKRLLRRSRKRVVST